MLSLFGLAGCATLPSPSAGARSATPPLAVWDVRAAQLANGAWVASGRFAVSALGMAGRGLQGGQGGFTWRHQDGRSDVEVSGPLGLGTVSLELEAAGARITQGGHEWHSLDPEGDIERRFGFPLPVRGLDHWLRGLPAPPPATPPPPGSVGFEQDGWVVEFTAFDAAGRPLRLSATRPGVRVRAVVTQWAEETP